MQFYVYTHTFITQRCLYITIVVNTCSPTFAGCLKSRLMLKGSSWSGEEKRSFPSRRYANICVCTWSRARLLFKRKMCAAGHRTQLAKGSPRVKQLPGYVSPAAASRGYQPLQRFNDCPENRAQNLHNKPRPGLWPILHRAHPGRGGLCQRRPAAASSEGPERDSH